MKEYDFRLIDVNKCDTNDVSINCDPHDVQEWLDSQPTVDAIPLDKAKEYGLFFTNDIIFSENLTAEEASQFVYLLKKAQGKIPRKE